MLLGVKIIFAVCVFGMNCDVTTTSYMLTVLSVFCGICMSFVDSEC